jgi:hypothetical protein
LNISNESNRNCKFLHSRYSSLEGVLCFISIESLGLDSKLKCLCLRLEIFQVSARLSLESWKSRFGLETVSTILLMVGDPITWNVWLTLRSDEIMLNVNLSPQCILYSISNRLECLRKVTISWLPEARWSIGSHVRLGIRRCRFVSRRNVMSNILEQGVYPHGFRSAKPFIPPGSMNWYQPRLEVKNFCDCVHL